MVRQVVQPRVRVHVRGRVDERPRAALHLGVVALPGDELRHLLHVRDPVDLGICGPRLLAESLARVIAFVESGRRVRGGDGLQGTFQMISPQSAASTSHSMGGTSFESACRPLATSTAKRHARSWMGASLRGIVGGRDGLGSLGCCDASSRG